MILSNRDGKELSSTNSAHLLKGCSKLSDENGQERFASSQQPGRKAAFPRLPEGSRDGAVTCTSITYPPPLLPRLLN